MQKTKVLPGQSIWDLAIQEYGEIDGAFLILMDNPGLDLATPLVAGAVLKIRDEVLNPTVVNYMKEKNIKPATAYYEPVPPTPTLIGLLAGNNYTGADWTVSGGAVAVFSPTQIELTNSGSAANVDTVVYDNYISDSEHLLMSVDCTVEAVPNFESGLVFQSPFSRSTYTAILDVVSGSPGTVRIYDDTGNILATASTGFPVNDKDKLRMMMQRVKNKIRFWVERTSPAPVSTPVITYDIPFAFGGATNLPAMLKFGFAHLQGQSTVVRWEVSTFDYTYCDLMFIGDAKMARYSIGGTAVGNGVADLWMSANPTKAILTNSGPGELTQHVVDKLPELQIYKPQKVVLCIGTEDIRSAVSNAVWQANYMVIYNALKALGADVYHQLPLTEAVLVQTSLSAWITANFPASKVIAVPGTWNTGTDTATGIYPNVSGNSKMYNQQITNITL